MKNVTRKIKRAMKKGAVDLWCHENLESICFFYDFNKETWVKFTERDNIVNYEDVSSNFVLSFSVYLCKKGFELF